MRFYWDGDVLKVAWAHFHKLLCVGPNPSSDHPMLKLEALARSFLLPSSPFFQCLALLCSVADRMFSECKRTNPLMIARIFAMVVQRVQTTDEDPRMVRISLPPPPLWTWNNQSKKSFCSTHHKAFAPFANFASNQEKFPHDMQALNYIEEQLFKDMSQAERAKFASGKGQNLSVRDDGGRWVYSSPTYTLVVNIEHFRLLNGAIMRNAQTICPGKCLCSTLHWQSFI